MAAPWMRNGSYMVFRRLEQQVPEFRRFVREQAARLGMDPDLLAARMVGRWKSGAPMELAPLRDDPGSAPRTSATMISSSPTIPSSADVPTRRISGKCTTRRTWNEAEAQRHRIIRAGIPFGPEVAPEKRQPSTAGD